MAAFQPNPPSGLRRLLRGKPRILSRSDFLSAFKAADQYRKYKHDAPPTVRVDSYLPTRPAGRVKIYSGMFPGVRPIFGPRKLTLSALDLYGSVRVYRFPPLAGYQIDDGGG